MVRRSEKHTVQLITVTKWRLEPRLCVLVLANMESQAGLDLGCSDAVILMDSGPGVWEPSVDAQVYRIIVEETIEEGLLRNATIRKILQDVN